ncbi:MAG: hypothetical protein V4515_10320 [Chloroflexota bacterium]
MNSPLPIIVTDPRLQIQANCLVCGNDIPAGEGLTARYGERTLRFKCPGCLARFEAAPEQYLAGRETSCCKTQDPGSSASEWTCDG